MNAYKIKTIWTGSYYSALILDRETENEIAEYRLNPKKETSETRKIRRSIDSHLNNGGTLKNYQW